MFRIEKPLNENISMSIESNEKIGNLNSKQPQLINRRKIWIYGLSLVGKTTTVEKALNDLHYKLLNKFWENFKGEKNLAIELDMPYSPEITLLIRLWTEDRIFWAIIKINIFIRQMKILLLFVI